MFLHQAIKISHGVNDSACAYFVTICTHDRECLFGTVADEKIVLNDTGKIVESEWLQTAEIRANVSTDAYIVMPNHFHGILFMRNVRRRGDRTGRPYQIRDITAKHIRFNNWTIQISCDQKNQTIRPNKFQMAARFLRSH